MPTSIRDRIFHEIEKNPKNSISFARYMEISLYGEPGGYYTNRLDRPIGRKGDFYTSVSVGETFGRLLALAAGAIWREDYDGGSEFTIVEQGAHDGQLARDFTTFAPMRDHVWRYVIIEPQPSARRRLESSLSGTGIEVVSSADQVGAKSGLFLCNELIDAFPVERVCWSGETWRQIRVARDGDHLVYAQASADHLPTQSLGVNFPDGYTTELSLGIDGWMAETSQLFSKGGHFWIIDYGYPKEIYYDPSRSDGTLRCYGEHRASDDPLEHKPGTVDITAHVDFTAVEQAAAAYGLRRCAPLTDQHQFLTRAAIPWLEQIEADGSAANDAATRSAVKQFQTLTHPGIMGRAFKVLQLQKPADS